MQQTLFCNISELMTNQPLHKEQRFHNIKREDLGIFENAWLATDHLGRVQAIGQDTPPREFAQFKKVDLKQYAVMPGLIDSHTHPVFAGERASEFSMRIDGKTYQEIAQEGGGIKASVQASRDASDEVLKHNCLTFFEKSLKFGVTTIEAKSGYGLSTEEELRHLRIIKECGQRTPVNIAATCLALHAIPEEFRSAKEFADQCARELLPQVAEKQLATFVDMFIEDGYFSPQDCEGFAAQAERLGLKIKVHADEFSDAKGAEFAARWHASSADHLQFAHHESLAAMARNNVVACLLPGTSLYTAIPFTNAHKIREAGCAMAIATDFNPGSCYLPNLPLMASMAGLHCKMTSSEVLTAVTWVAAKALESHDCKGALCKGMDADFFVLPHKKLDNWLADAGQSLAKEVYIKGARKV